MGKCIDIHDAFLAVVNLLQSKMLHHLTLAWEGNRRCTRQKASIVKYVTTELLSKIILCIYVTSSSREASFRPLKTAS